jgi:hypothetical protein
MSIAAVPPELSAQDQRIEEMFDEADDLMINQKQYTQAVSISFVAKHDCRYRFTRK